MERDVNFFGRALESKRNVVLKKSLRNRTAPQENSSKYNSHNVGQ